MALINYLKIKKRGLGIKKNIFIEYMHDCFEYMKYNYNNPKIKSQNALESKILRQAHILEKGMSLSVAKPHFGVKKAEELIRFINEFVFWGYDISKSTPVINSIKVLKSYLDFHKELGFIPESVLEGYEKLSRFKTENTANNDIKTMTLEYLNKEIHSEFPKFFASRHSVRQFSDKKINIEDLKKAVELAMCAPSACNRQSCRIYYYQDKDINSRLSEMIAGNTGFENDAQGYLVITSDMSAFYNQFERNQIYVDGGIMGLALAESLHYCGIANCILQNGEFFSKNKRFHEVCGNIPNNEKIILFIAIGYYKENVTYAVSKRKKLEEVFQIR